MLLAGLLQFTPWKTRQLACCRTVPSRNGSHESSADFRHGLHLGARCIRCCLGPTAVLLCLGVMDLRVMTLAMAGIALERLSPGERAARGIGAVIVVLAAYWLVGQSVM